MLRTLERDIAVHRAPLVYRMDRASCHRTEPISDLLRQDDILVPRQNGIVEESQALGRRATRPGASEPPPEDGKLIALPVLGGVHHDYRLAA